MKDKDLRKMIGSRIKQRRTELGLHQKYIAELMDVNASTIQRYEAGTIDNTKKLILEGLAEALHVSVEWLKGETDAYESDVNDNRDIQIRDLIGRVVTNPKDGLDDDEYNFSRDLLIYMLNEYELFLGSFKNGCENYKDTNKYEDIAKAMGMKSITEYNEFMFLKEVMPMINAYNDIADVIRLYSKNSKKATQRIQVLLENFKDEE